MRRTVMAQNLSNPFITEWVPFITEWVVTNGQTITLPTVSGYTYNAVVNWGDGSSGTINTYNVGNSHTYTNAGTYRIKITGIFSAWSFNNAGSKLAITKVVSWGNVGELIYGFYGCTNLISIPSSPIPANINRSSLASIFRASGLTSVPENVFQLQTGVTNMSRIFQSGKLASLPTNLLRYNVNVTTLFAAFTGNFFTSIPSDFLRYNTSLVDTSSIFQDCTLLTAIPADLFRYNINITNIDGVFNRCYALLSIPADIFKYNISITTCESCFSECIALTTLPEDLFYYNVNIINYSFALYRLRNISLPTRIFDLSALYKVAKFNGTFEVLNTTYSYTGTVQDIWNYATPILVTACFKYNTALTNYASIPAAWKL